MFGLLAARFHRVKVINYASTSSGSVRTKSDKSTVPVAVPNTQELGMSGNASAGLGVCELVLRLVACSAGVLLQEKSPCRVPGTCS